ncbi:248_t:CDS:2, partial [Racocetra fulgida]
LGQQVLPEVDEHGNVLAMSQLHSDILSKRKCNEAEKAEKQYKRICIATLIQPYNESEAYNSGEENQVQEKLAECFFHTKSDSEDSIISISDNLQTNSQTNPQTHSNKPFKMNEDMIDDSDTFNKETWSHIVEGWVNMLNDKELDNESANNKQFEFELSGRITHSTDDLSAKWSLLGLFNNLLEASERQTYNIQHPSYTSHTMQEHPTQKHPTQECLTQEYTTKERSTEECLTYTFPK